MGITTDLIKSFWSDEHDGDRWSHVKFLSKIWLHHIYQKAYLHLRYGELRWPGEKIGYENLNILNGRCDPIAIVPIFSSLDQTDGAVVHAAARIARELLGIPVRILKPRQMNGNSIDGDNILDEYSSENVLKRFSRVLILTNLDMYSSGHRWVYGYAGLRTPCCAVSTRRLGFHGIDRPRDVPIDSWKKLIRVVIHELGHTFGLPHCPYESCIMHDVPDAGLIGLPLHFCASCRTTILKVQR